MSDTRDTLTVAAHSWNKLIHMVIPYICGLTLVLLGPYILKWLYFYPLKRLRRWPSIKPALVQRLVFAASQSVLWVFCAVSLSPIHFSPALSYRWSNTCHWPNAGLMLALRLRRWANISPVLGYPVVLGATLNVGQRHRRRTNINWPAYWPASTTLAQHLTDIGSVSACNRGQQ